MSKSKRSSKKKKSRRNMTTKDSAIYKALVNSKQTISVIDQNGIKRWLNPYEFISALNKSIKYYKRHLSTEEADIMINNYDMPAVQRCLQGVLMMNYGKNFGETDLNKYIARRFKHITIEMLSKDYQTEGAFKFKEDHDKFRSSAM